MDRKRDKKQNYKQKFAQSKRNEEIKRGITGFLVTCESSKEKRCIREIFNVLNDFVEKVYPDLDLPNLLKPQNSLPEQEGGTSKRQKRGEDDLDQELNQIQRSKRIWYTFDTGQPGVIFIKLLDQMREYINVGTLMQAILEHLKQNETNVLTRFTCRMLPVFSLQKANLEDFKQSCLGEIARHFKDKPLKWCLEFKSRNNLKAVRAEFYEAVKNCVMESKLEHTVSFDEADVEVLVEVFRDILVFGCMPGYKAQYKRYNMQALQGQSQQAEEVERPVVKLADLIKMREQAQVPLVNQEEHKEVSPVNPIKKDDVSESSDSECCEPQLI